MKKKLGVGLTFHDETPSTPSAKFASVPSEFHQKPTEQGNSITIMSRVHFQGELYTAIFWMIGLILYFYLLKSDTQKTAKFPEAVNIGDEGSPQCALSNT